MKVFSLAFLMSLSEYSALYLSIHHHPPFRPRSPIPTKPSDPSMSTVIDTILSPSNGTRDLPFSSPATLPPLSPSPPPPLNPKSSSAQRNGSSPPSPPAQYSSAQATKTPQ